MRYSASLRASIAISIVATPSGPPGSRAPRIAGHIAGGTHHAFADRGEGFCVFNDIAVAAQVALLCFYISADVLKYYHAIEEAAGVELATRIVGVVSEDQLDPEQYRRPPPRTPHTPTPHTFDVAVVVS